MPRNYLARIALALAAHRARRNLRHDQSGRMSAESVGAGLIILGAVLAFVDLLLVLAVSNVYWTFTYAWVTGLIGVLMLGAGIAVRSAD